MKIAPRKKPGGRLFLIACLAWALVYACNGWVQRQAYGDLLRGNTARAMRLAGAAVTLEPNYYLHRGYKGRETLIEAFRETDRLLRGKKLAWVMKMPKPSSSSPIFAGGAVFVGGETGKLYKLNLATGRAIWEYNAGRAIETRPVEAGGIVYAAAYNGVHAVDVKTGRRVWFFRTSYDDSFPEYASGTVLTGEQKGYVTAIDAKTGRMKWRFDSGAEMQAGFVVGGGRVIFGNTGGEVYALDFATGKRIWKYTIGGAIEGNALLMNGVVYVGGKNGVFAALDFRDGTLIWRKKMPGPVKCFPAGQGGKVIVGIYSMPRGQLMALDARTGAEIWTNRDTGPIESSPVISGGVVYVGSHYGYIMAVRLSDGKTLWRFLTGWDIDKSIPAVADGLVAVAGMDGRVYAFKIEKD
jgi:outer membrane protein assembly factor BamB